MSVLYLAVFVAVFVVWRTFALHAIRARVVDTALPPDQVRTLFVTAAGGNLWRVVDEGNPLVLQSSLLTGFRQRIGLHVRPEDGRTRAEVSVLRYAGQWIGLPRRPWTLRWRLEGFVARVNATDPTARTVSG